MRSTTYSVLVVTVLLVVAESIHYAPPRVLDEVGAATWTAAWENANAESIAKARACLPPVLQNFYVPNMTAGTAGANATDALECEQLILFHTYQRLSTAFNICRALSHGVRMCAHFLDVYSDEKLTIPAAMPRRSLVATIALCEAAIEALPGRSARQAVRDAFRYRFSNGTICLRQHTVHGRVPTFLV